MASLLVKFAEGEDLKHHVEGGLAYTLAQTLRTMDDLLSALTYAHQQNVVRRVLKLADLLMAAGGHIKLADFEMARIQDLGNAPRTLGTIVGTPKYMLPKQLESKPDICPN